MRICPVDREWIHDHIMEPYLQGAELCKIAWSGEDKSLKPNPLSSKERVIYWLQGASLMIPFVNTIIWIAWQTFGTPEKLFDPFCPEIPPPPAPPTKVIIHNTASSISSVKRFDKPTETSTFIEKEGDSELKMKWEVKYLKDKIVADQQCDHFFANSVYRPEDWSLKEYSYQMGSTEFRMWQDDENQKEIRASLKKDGILLPTKTFQLTENLPVIQHRAIGLRPFVLSEKPEMVFYAVVPEIPFMNYLPYVEQPPLLMKATAKKMGLEETEFGSLVKVEIIPEQWLYNKIIKCEMWFDPATGQLKKFVDTGKFIETKCGELVRSSPSRE